MFCFSNIFSHWKPVIPDTINRCTYFVYLSGETHNIVMSHQYFWCYRDNHGSYNDNNQHGGSSVPPKNLLCQGHWHLPGKCFLATQIPHLDGTLLMTSVAIIFRGCCVGPKFLSAKSLLKGWWSAPTIALPLVLHIDIRTGSWLVMCCRHVFILLQGEVAT